MYRPNNACAHSIDDVSYSTAAHTVRVDVVHDHGGTLHSLTRPLAERKLKQDNTNFPYSLFSRVCFR